MQTQVIKSSLELFFASDTIAKCYHKLVSQLYNNPFPQGTMVGVVGGRNKYYIPLITSLRCVDWWFLKQIQQ